MKSLLTTVLTTSFFASMIAVSGHAVADCESQAKELNTICGDATDICNNTKAGSDACQTASDKCIKAAIEYAADCGSETGE